MLAQAVPSARRIAILWDSIYEQHKIAAPSIEATAQKLAVTLQLVPARTAEEFDTAFASAAVPALSGIFALAVECAAALDAAGIQGIDS